MLKYVNLGWECLIDLSSRSHSPLSYYLGCFISLYTYWVLLKGHLQRLMKLIVNAGEVSIIHLQNNIQSYYTALMYSFMGINLDQKRKLHLRMLLSTFLLFVIHFIYFYHSKALLADYTTRWYKISMLISVVLICLTLIQKEKK